jgi:hypothetical protein
MGIIPAIVEACASFVIVLDRHPRGAKAFLVALLIWGIVKVLLRSTG